MANIYRSYKNTLGSYFKRNLGVFTLLIIGKLGVAGSLVLWSLYMKRIGDAFTKSYSNDVLMDLLYFGAFYLIIYFATNMFEVRVRNIFLYKVSYQLKTDILNSVFEKDINTYNLTNSAKYISILNNDVPKIENDYFLVICSIIGNILTSIVATITLFVYNAWIALVTITLSFLPMIVVKITGKSISKKQGAYFKTLEQYNSRIKDILNAFELIKSFNASKKIVEIHSKSVTKVEDNKINHSNAFNASDVTQGGFVYLQSILSMMFQVFLLITGRINAGIFFGAMQISNYVSNPINNMTRQLLRLKSVESIKFRIEEVLNDSSIFRNIDELQNLISSTPIVLKNLSFSYGDKKVISDINFTFEKGKKYALVGSSGSGKSTLIKLIMRYYDDYLGEIIVGNQNIKKVNKASFSQEFSMIHQRTVLFDDTLCNNISLFQDFSIEEITEAVNRAGLNMLIKSLPEGLSSNVNESGNNFSGGEQQRIAIARALLKKASVLLCDEATSSLDNELAIQIERLILEKDLTAIVITHKLVNTLLKKYDCIIALKNGVIEEVGSFEELMVKKGYFYSLYTLGS